MESQVYKGGMEAPILVKISTLLSRKNTPPSGLEWNWHPPFFFVPGQNFDDDTIDECRRQRGGNTHTHTPAGKIDTPLWDFCPWPPVYGIDSNLDLMRKWFTFNIFAIDNEADWGIVIMYAIDGIFPSVAQNFMHFGRFPSLVI